MSKKIVVIGNGMVGHKFLEALTDLDSKKNCSIICFGEEPRPAYDRIHLSEFFTGKSADDLLLAPLSFYAERGIDLKVSNKVVSIDREKNQVIDQFGVVYDYDVLVFATGSSPFLPAISGVDRRGVFLYRTIEDLEAIRAFAKGRKRGAVIGGGLLGLEAAKAMKDLGLKTGVIEFAPRLMPRQIDQVGSSVLENKLKEMEVEIYTNKSSRAILGNDKELTAIEFSDDSELPIQMLVISAGIIPRDELARAVGLPVGNRGGIVVDENLKTEDPNIFAIGECALANSVVWGLAAPGYRMAEAVAAQIMGLEHKPFTGADLSTKLKLMGVDVASIGNSVPQGGAGSEVTLIDTGTGVYKKLHVDPETRTITGAILVGDASDYSQILQMYQNKVQIPERAESLLVKGGGAPAFGVEQLGDDAVICGCNNVSKGTICKAVSEGINTVDGIKLHTKAASSCGSCTALVKDVITFKMKDLGLEVDKSLCEHFKYTRQELFEIIQIKKIKDFRTLISQHGNGLGCEICKPTAASIFASLWHENAQNQANLQDTNDRFMANIQKNGTYSIVPRIPGGEIKPEHLLAIAKVAMDYGLYTKITGAQRIDLFGAQLDDLPAIWKALVDAGLESGQAYAKALRAVKSCVGSTWCRFGLQDSTSLAIEIEERYRGLRSPHKLKMAVSGCARECAEAQGKDVGIIATPKGWNLYVCGNGGMNPKHAILLAQDLDKETLIRSIDRFLIYYIRTADKLTRTSVWLEKLPGGLQKLKDVVLSDSLGIGAEMEAEMAQAVKDYECEWTATLKDPEKLKRFKTFVNSPARDENVKFDRLRGQIVPVLVGKE